MKTCAPVWESSITSVGMQSNPRTQLHQWPFILQAGQQTGYYRVKLTCRSLTDTDAVVWILKGNYVVYRGNVTRTLVLAACGCECCAALHQRCAVLVTHETRDVPSITVWCTETCETQCHNQHSRHTDASVDKLTVSVFVLWNSSLCCIK